FTNMRFEPAGMTDDPDVRMAQSIVDYIFRRLALDFLPFETRSALGIHTAEERQPHLATRSPLLRAARTPPRDGPVRAAREAPRHGVPGPARPAGRRPHGAEAGRGRRDPGPEDG